MRWLYTLRLKIHMILIELWSSISRGEKEWKKLPFMVRRIEGPFERWANADLEIELAEEVYRT